MARIIDPGYSKHRVKRVLGKNVFDISEKKFLVLLLVIEAEDQDRLDFVQRRLVRFVEHLGKGLVD